MAIESRWTPDTPEYQKALIMLRERRYQRALDHLERLVIQRLFKLAKLGISGIGMRHTNFQVSPNIAMCRLQTTGKNRESFEGQSGGYQEGVG
jgi:hypothetical protein